jgi:hypothetical protein
MQLTVHDHWLLQTFPLSDTGERSEAEKALPSNLRDALERARRIQEGLEPMAAAERAVIEAARRVVRQPRTWRALCEPLAQLDRLRAAQASEGSAT